jgi:hypothetical protein
MSVVLTAAVSDASDAGSIAESIGDLDGYFRSDEGRALLSRTQDAETVTVLETDAVGDMFLLHASDTSAGAVEGVVPDYWRAYFDLGPRIATLSVLAMEGEGVTREDSLGALRGIRRSPVRTGQSSDADGHRVLPPCRPRIRPKGVRRAAGFSTSACFGEYSN